MHDREEEIVSALPAELDALPRLQGFRLRGMQMTRLETFIDAAFAISMIVVGLLLFLVRMARSAEGWNVRIFSPFISVVS
jgi:hypothetical protein